MKSILLSAQIVTLVLLLTACNGRSKTSSPYTEADTIPMRHAENLLLIETKEYTEAQLRNPWDTTQILHTYFLIDKNKDVPSQLPEGTIVRTPLSKVVVYTAVHCALIKELGALKSIGGVCDLPYIKVPEIQEGVKNGILTDAGDARTPNVERIIDLYPDALMLSPFENSGGYGPVEKLNIPIIECADYMETSPLARAEWIRFYGRLLGRTKIADSLFVEIEKSYLELKTLTESIKNKPTMIADLKSGSAWYTPGGRSTTGRLYADAGARYAFANHDVSGSVPLSFETVFEKGQDANFWLIKYNQAKDKTYAELEEEYAPYAGFRAFKERKIYGCNTSYVPFYEDFPFHPHLILKDLIKIFHPSLLPSHDLKYFTNLAE